MRLPRLVLSLVILFVPTHVLADPPYFVINDPSSGTQWVNNQTNYATWTMGRDQGIYDFDVELVRMSSDGIVYVALNVPASAPNLPIHLQDVPPADDYYLVFLNSTHGLMYALSSRFSIIPASANASSSVQPPSKQLSATVTVSGAPNPTVNFAYTFMPSGAREAWSVCGAAVGLIGLAVSLWTIS